MKKFYALFMVVIVLQTTNVFGQFNSLSLDGTGDYVNIPYVVDLNPTSFTIEAWFKTNNSSATQVIMSSLGGGQGGYTIFTDQSQVLFQTANSGSTNNFYSGYTVTTDWTHVACTYDESTSTRKIFINGVEEASSTSAVYGLNSSGPFRIGCHATELNYFFSGKIDEVKIWNTAHTASQIQEFMNMEMTGTEDGLVAYYQMSDGTGNSLTDNSSNANTGTLVGNTAWVGNDNGPKGILPSGDGSSNPYQIESLANLYWLTQNTAEWDMAYEQTTNIDASITSGWDGGAGFWPIGINLAPDFFTGSYDGQGHTIDGLFINRSRNSIGFIGSGSGASISNIGLTNVNFTSPITSYVGGLVGICTNGTSFSNCYVTGTVSGKYIAGGLIGDFFSGAIINCYSTVNVTRNSGTYVDFGAFIGKNRGTVENCYSTGSVYYTGVSDPADKGFVGVHESGTYTNNFFDSEASNQTTGTGATAKTTAQMKTQSTFTGWDFSVTWAIDTGLNNGYPLLSVGFPTVVTTQAVTDITGGSATGNGTITVLGYPAPTAYGICWNTTGTPTISDSKTDNGAPAATGAFAAAITGLELSTTYYVRAYVTNVIETIYGDEVSFESLLEGVAPEGDGSQISPYRIEKLANLLWMSQQMGPGSLFLQKYFIQTANIDASATSSWNSNEGWIPIGNASYWFRGNYDGMGFVINGLTINKPASSYLGLFGLTLYGALKNIGLTNVNIVGSKYLGGLAGRTQENQLENCFVTGSIKGQQFVGGVMGGYNEIIMSNCYSIMDSVNASDFKAGGLSGGNLAALVSTFSNCYSSSIVVSPSTQGGLIGSILSTTTLSNCFWNTDATLIGIGDDATPTGAAGKTESELQTESTFINAGWDFIGETTNGAEDIWDIDGTTNNGYPFFYKSLPNVTTQAIGDITTTTAKGNGNVTDLGHPGVYDHGVCWNTTGNPTIADYTTNNNVAYATGAFTTSMTGLAAGTTYYVRAYATTTSGTAYGDVVNFTTLFENITWDGSEGTAWNNVGNWNTGATPSSSHNVTIPGSLANYPTIESGVNTDCHDLSLASGAELTINHGGSLKTGGTITNNGTFNMNLSVDDGEWHLISIPTIWITANSFLGDYLQQWDETIPDWIDISDPEAPLNTNIGYALWASGNKSSYTFTGTPLTGEQTTTVTLSDNYSTDEGNDGANLLGNPYPSSIDWSDLDDTWGAVYYWDPSANSGVGDYIEWNDGVGSGSQYIPPMQGFFIVVDESNTSEGSGTFSLSNENRTHLGATGFYKSKIQNGLVLETRSGENTDELFIRFAQDATNAFDLKKDALKFFAGAEGVAQIYAFGNSHKLAIDTRPETGTIQLGFANDESGFYSIAITEADGISKATLEDTKTQTFHDLSKGAYEFAWDVTDDEKRFKLHLNAVGIEEKPAGESDILIYAANGNIYIRATEHTGAVEHVQRHSGSQDGSGTAQHAARATITDIMGRTLHQQEISGNSLTIIPVNYKTGVYIVTVENGNQIKTEKVFIK